MLAVFRVLRSNTIHGCNVSPRCGGSAVQVGRFSRSGRQFFLYLNFLRSRNLNKMLKWICVAIWLVWGGGSRRQFLVPFLYLNFLWSIILEKMLKWMCVPVWLVCIKRRSIEEKTESFSIVWACATSCVNIETLVGSENILWVHFCSWITENTFIIKQTWNNCRK